MYKTRLSKLQDIITTNTLDALIVEAPTNILYLTGLELSKGLIMVTKKGSSTLFVDGRYYEDCKERSPFPVELFDPKALHTKTSERIGFDSSRTTYSEFMALKEVFTTQLVAIENPFKTVRAIKDTDECNALRRSAALASDGFKHGCSLLKEGISEREIATEIEIFWKRRGAEGPSFDINVSFGINSAFPHHHAGNDTLKTGDIVLMDIGTTLDGYASDMTRVVAFGTPNQKLVEIYDIVKSAQQSALDICRPGSTLGALDSAARDVITAAGYGEFFTHGLGHGIGLDVHEHPFVRNREPFASIPLEPGMAITIEPGIYLPDLGGIRIEDTIIITNDGHENLILVDKTSLLS